MTFTHAVPQACCPAAQADEPPPVADTAVVPPVPSVAGGETGLEQPRASKVTVKTAKHLARDVMGFIILDS